MTKILDLKASDVVRHALASRVEQITDHGTEVGMTWVDCNGYVESGYFPHDMEFKLLGWDAETWNEFRKL